MAEFQNLVCCVEKKTPEVFLWGGGWGALLWVLPCGRPKRQTTLQFAKNKPHVPHTVGVHRTASSGMPNVWIFGDRTSTSAQALSPSDPLMALHIRLSKSTTSSKGRASNSRQVDSFSLSERVLVLLGFVAFSVSVKQQQLAMTRPPCRATFVD